VRRVKEKLTCRSSIKPETLGLGCQVFWSMSRPQDVSCIVQFGLKDPHLLEQAMNRIFKGCVVIDINKYGTENMVSKGSNDSDFGALYRSKESRTALKLFKTGQLFSMGELSMHTIFLV
jgi:hypothetical protein